MAAHKEMVKRLYSYCVGGLPVEKIDVWAQSFTSAMLVKNVLESLPVPNDPNRRIDMLIASAVSAVDQLACVLNEKIIEELEERTFDK